MAISYLNVLNLSRYYHHVAVDNVYIYKKKPAVDDN